jgi:predicted transcriptional regulator
MTDRVELARRLRSEGMRLIDIALVLGVAPSTVCRWTTPGAADRHRQAERARYAREQIPYYRRLAELRRGKTA